MKIFLRKTAGKIIAIEAENKIMKIFSSFIGGIAIGFGAYIVLSSDGKKLLRRFLDSMNDGNDEGRTYNISELTSENSDSLEEIKEKFES